LRIPVSSIFSASAKFPNFIQVAPSLQYSAASTSGIVFIRAICAAPDDDRLRLVYADWLEEHGDGVRAEFIRLQCALESADRFAPGRRPLLWREIAYVPQSAMSSLDPVYTVGDQNRRIYFYISPVSAKVWVLDSHVAGAAAAAAGKSAA